MKQQAIPGDGVGGRGLGCRDGGDGGILQYTCTDLGHFWLRCDEVDKGSHGTDSVQHPLVHVDVQHLSPVLHLCLGNGQGFLKCMMMTASTLMLMILTINRFSIALFCSLQQTCCAWYVFWWMQGYFGVSLIHQTVTLTTQSLMMRSFCRCKYIGDLGL